LLPSLLQPRLLLLLLLRCDCRQQQLLWGALRLLDPYGPCVLHYQQQVSCSLLLLQLLVVVLPPSWAYEKLVIVASPQAPSYCCHCCYCCCWAATAAFLPESCWQPPQKSWEKDGQYRAQHQEQQQQHV
jgi:hypothetical protein